MVKFNAHLTNLVRNRLQDFADVEEKPMFNCWAFMVNGKLCMGIKEYEMFFRIDPTIVEEVVERIGCREMTHGKIRMKGYMMVEEEVLRQPAEFNFWANLALAYNPFANSSKAKKPKNKSKD